MKRREFLKGSAVLGVAAAMPASWLGRISAPGSATSVAGPLKPPAKGPIPVAFLLSEGAVLIDFAGPWEVFQDVMVPTRGEMEDQMPFRLYTVAADTKPIRTSGGLQILPDFGFENAPAPKVIVIPAQKGSPQAESWVRESAKGADLTMSVCTGAFLLARTGLLSGKSATTHHNAYRALAAQFPEIRVQRGVRFVDEGSVASAGGLSSGIDLALHAVERYFGKDAAQRTAFQMEYQGEGWQNPAANAIYARRPVSTAAHPLCPVCDMEVDPATAPKSVYRGKTYWFCSADDKATFDAAPEKILATE